MTKGVHPGDRCHLRCITIVKSVNALGQRRATGRFYRQETDILAIRLVRNKRKGNTGKVGSAAMTTNNHVRIITGNLHLLLGFEANNRLVQTNMIQHTTKSITGILVCRCIFNRFTDSNPQRTLIVWIFLENSPASIGLI